MFPSGELLASLSPDEVLALGAASQASLLNEAWLDGGNTEDESGPVRTKLTATSQSIVYTLNPMTKNESEQSTLITTTLIPAGIPIPTRRSNHLTDSDIASIEGINPRIEAALFTKSEDGNLTKITMVSSMCES